MISISVPLKDHFGAVVGKFKTGVRETDSIDCGFMEGGVGGRDE